VTRVRNVLFSHFRISQQFFKLLTEESLELSADSDLACKVVSENTHCLAVCLVQMYVKRLKATLVPGSSLGQNNDYTF
jgi:hypothetical protein